ncbi:hypothetical protein [Bacillus sp. RB3]|uniref:hypothetical protein n=1 Tax=Bacillus sp. RB3 TaxID=3050012 RepID=UPI0025410D99|nr:hypothetical protein [Bacillus sp. RB3]MDK3010895.1 hypothetical protein [Bacillus sp. RB3]
MDDYFNNGVELLLDKDTFLEKYGCVKIEYREYENRRYYIYAFDNALPEWDFNTGKLLMVTQDEEIIDSIKSQVFFLELGSFFAKSVLEKKR